MATIAEKWVEQGIEQGIQKGEYIQAREDILAILEARFGKLTESIVSQVQRLEDRTILKTLLRSAATVSSAETFQQTLEKAVRD